MSGDKQQTNGKDQTNDNATGTDDVEMNDGTSKPSKTGKSGKDKDGDDEMTVVVPPSKNTSSSGKDLQSSTAVNGATEESDESSKEPDVDPREKAINGMSRLSSQFGPTRANLYSQTSKPTSLFLSVPCPSLILASVSVFCAPSPQPVHIWQQTLSLTL